jgi:formyltetrahydrofolate-dependent phosphoribosylglycinamide formyltransferase
MADNYISTLAEIAQWRDELDRAGKKLVLTNGCFDLLHAGHVRYLNEARALGDALVVAINSDESVTELKGPHRPVYPEADRAEILCALESVDRVVVFGEKRATHTIATIRPHIYTKGGDYTAANLIDEEKALLDQLGIEIRILSLVPGRSTSATLAKSALSSGGSGKSLPRIALLGSGTGSNAKAIIQAVKAGAIPAEIGLVISDVKDSGVMNHAIEAGLPAIYIEPGTEKPGRLTDAACKEIADKLTAARVSLVALCGFMRILREPILSRFPRQIINIHPSLLPEFPGRNACELAIAAGVTESGCTIHYVDGGIDTGEIIRQARVPIYPGDDVAALKKKINQEETALYPQVIAALIKMPSIAGA